MINLLRSLIRLGTITQLFNRYGIIRSQASFLDSQAPENIIHLQPYGFNACPPVGSQIITMSVYGHAEHKYGIPINATDANIQKLQAGETVIYNQVGTKIYLKADGNIEITPNGSSVIINSDVDITDGDLSILKIGKGLNIASGANAKAGIATLVSGTITISNTSITANSLILITPQIAAGSEYGAVRVSAIIPSTSFTITSYRCNNTTTIATGDTSTVAWQIIEAV